MNLEGFYKYKLNKYKNNNKKEEPAKLLAIQLLLCIKYIKQCNNIYMLYFNNKKLIDSKIEKIENDFDLNKIDSYNNIKNTKDGIFALYSDSLETVRIAYMYYKDKTIEEAYAFCFDEDINKYIVKYNQKLLKLKNKGINIILDTI